MASFNLGPDEFKHLELLRVRLQQLTNSLGSMGSSIVMANPLPTAESLQAQAVILQHNLQSLQTIMNENSALFQRITVHPSTNYPGRTQEHILTQLLRKKPEPDVEAWIEGGRAAALHAGLTPAMLGSRAGDQRRGGGGGGRDDLDDGYDDDDDDEPSDPFNEQWADILQVCRDGIKEYVQTDAQRPYTRDEYAMGVQKVRTGLKRSLEDDEDEDEEDEDEDEDEETEGRGQGHGGGATEAAGPPAAGRQGNGGQNTGPSGNGSSNGAGRAALLQPEHVLWFLTRGDTGLSPLNTNITFESQRRAAREALGRQQR